VPVWPSTAATSWRRAARPRASPPPQHDGAAWRDLTSGRAGLDADRAVAAAQSYLRQAGVGGTASAAPDHVTVTVTITEPTVVLGAFGIGPKTVSATRSASPFTGG
jgi:hypothetical protein